MNTDEPCERAVLTAPWIGASTGALKTRSQPQPNEMLQMAPGYLLSTCSIVLAQSRFDSGLGRYAITFFAAGAITCATCKSIGVSKSASVGSFPRFVGFNGGRRYFFV